MASNTAGQAIFDGFVARGFTPVQAAVLAGNMQQESSFNPDAYNPNENAFGGFQWRLDRKTGLENYAQATGRAANDINTQMDWVVQEMTGAEARAAAPFLAATTPEAANAAIKKYIRWGDNSDATRLQNAMAYMAPQPANQAVQAIGGATAGNMLTGDNAGFVNPAFGGSPFQMPAAPAPIPVQAAPATPLPGLPAPAASPVAPAVTDDDLLNSFLTPAAPAAQPVAAPVAPVSVAAPVAGSDDELLNQWAAPTVTPPGLSAAPQQAPLGSEVAPTPPGYDPSVVGASAMAAGEPEPAAAADPNYQPSMVPFLDPVNAFANAAVDAIPFVGPKLTEMGRGVDAAFNNMLTGQSQTGEDRAAINAATAAQYPVQSMAGTVAGTVAPLIAAGGTTLGAKVLGMSGSVPQRVIAGGLSSAAIAGGDTLARGGSLEDAKNNALIGGGIGAGLPIVGNAVNKLIAPAVSPRIAQLAQMARDQFGIAIGPGQMSTNPVIKLLDTLVNKIPMSGGTVSREAQQEAFNRAVSATFGENAPAITADVLESARTRIGTMFDDVAANTPTIKADAAFDQQMLDAMTTAQQTLTDAELVPLTRQFDALVGKFQQGGNAIDGTTYQALTRKGTPLDLALHSPNPNIRQVAGDFREALDGALERSAAPDVLADLQAARSQWRALKTIQTLADKGPLGDVSPALLQGAVARSYNGMPTNGAGGDLANLARIGQQFLKPMGSSNTAENAALINMLTKGGGAAAGVGGLLLNPGLLVPAAVAAGSTLAAGKVLGAGLRSKALGNMLINNGLKTTGGPARNALMAPALPALAATPNAPLRIVVDGAGSYTAQ